MSNIDTRLEKAVRQGNLDEVKALLSAGGANPNFRSERSEFGGPLLHDTNNVEIVRELISHGAYVDAENEYGETALHRAAIGNLLLVREFLKCGAYVNARNRRGNTPLNFAVMTSNRNIEIISELLEHGADINIRNKRGRGSNYPHTPLENAGSCAPLLVKITLLKNFDKNYRNITDMDAYKEVFSHTELSNYLEDCVCEVTKMKTERIDDSLSLYEFITSKTANKELYIYDEGVKRIKNSVFQVLTSTNYPIYQSYISTKICLSLERESLLIKLSELEVCIKLVPNHTQGTQEKTVALNSDSKHEIAQYLSNIDLLNFIIAFYKYIDDKSSSLKRNFTESSTLSNKSLSEASTSSYAKRSKLE